MARGRPHGRSKSDHRVCQEARHARAAEYRERIAISAEQQEARIAAVNAKCNMEDAPRRRRGQKSRAPKIKAGAARMFTGGRACKESGSLKKKAKKGLEHSLGKAAERDLHNLHCHACGATADFGLRGSKEGGSVKYLCRAHATSNGFFRVDRDRAAWAEDTEMRHLRAKERSLEEELRDLDGTSPAAKSTSVWSGSQSERVWADAPSAPPFAAWQQSDSMTDWVSMPQSRSLIATLLLRGGVESNPGPTSQEEKELALKKSWQEVDSDIDSDLLNHLAKQQLTLERWRGMTDDGRSKLLDRLEREYPGPGNWLLGWNAIFDKAAGAAEAAQLGVGATQAVQKQVESLQKMVESHTLRMRQLEMRNNKSMQTTWIETDVGQMHYQLAEVVQEMQCLAHVSKKMVKTAVSEVLKNFPTAVAEGAVYKRQKQLSAGEKRRRDEAGQAVDVDNGDDQPNPELKLPTGLPGLSLADAIPEAKEPGLSEEKHMQPVLMTILGAMAKAAKCEMVLEDTHSSSNEFQNPRGKPDCSLLASPIIAWTQAVSFVEAKLGHSIPETHHSFGQQTKRVRNTLDQQPERSHMVTIGITMNSVEVATFSRNHLEVLSVQRTGPIPFSVSEESPGFIWVLRVLASGKKALGFQQLTVPSVKKLGHKKIEKLELLHRGTAPQLDTGMAPRVHRGTAPQGQGSLVFQARIAGLGRCILKLNQSERETLLVSELTKHQVPRVVTLLAADVIKYQSSKWHAVLLHPFAQPVTSELGLQLLSQVTSDVARAIRGCIEARVLQRDVTPNNIGVYEGRGVLFDFSAGKLLPPNTDPRDQPTSPTGSVQQITGTLVYAPLSILCGKPHTESSMLEGLFISMLDRCSGGKLHGRHEMDINNLEKAQFVRRGSMLGPSLKELGHIPGALQSFVRGLHDLFYPFGVSREVRTYSTNVTMEQVQAVCKIFHPTLLDT